MDDPGRLEGGWNAPSAPAAPAPAGATVVEAPRWPQLAGSVRAQAVCRMADPLGAALNSTPALIDLNTIDLNKYGSSLGRYQYHSSFWVAIVARKNEAFLFRYNSF